MRRRLDKLSTELRELNEAADRAAAVRRAREKVSNWTATRADFEALAAPTLDDDRAKLIERAATYRYEVLGFGMSQGPPEDVCWVAPAILASDPAQPTPTDHYEVLLQAAQPPQDLPEDVSTWPSPWESDWLRANLDLVALGHDRGASLRSEAAPGPAEPGAHKSATRRRLKEKIDHGEAEWPDFMIWFLPEFEGRQHELAVYAALRRQARESGTPLPLKEIRDFAAEIASYPCDQEMPGNFVQAFEVGCKEKRPADGAGHVQWVEANYWRSALGGGWGAQIREHLTEHWTEYLDQEEGKG
jgi:hypothetical protein